MILQCPACQARFAVPDSAIPADGRTVKCGKCANQWFVDAPAPAAVVASAPVMPAPVTSMEEPPSPETEALMREIADALSEPQPMRARPMPKGSNLPVVKKPKLNPRYFKIAAPVLAASWVVLALITYSPSWSETPGISAVYGMLGASSTKGLVFDDVHMDREQDGNKARFILSGSIRNDTNAVRKVPAVRVLLKDKDEKVLWGREYAVNVELKAGEVYPFRIPNVETNFAGSVKDIVVDLGHSLQLMVR